VMMSGHVSGCPHPQFDNSRFFPATGECSDDAAI
jgi:hypothetical protein